MIKKILIYVLSKVTIRFALFGLNCRRLQLCREFDEYFKSTIAFGILKGTKLSRISLLSWNFLDRANILFGLYEMELVEKIKESAHKSNGTFFDIGAADGIYCVGLTKNGIFRNAVAFEKSRSGRVRIKQLADKNEVSEKIEIKGAATIETLLEIEPSKLQGAVFLFDIEGAEFEILNALVFQHLSRCNIFIELHFNSQESSLSFVRDWIQEKSDLFEVAVFTTGPRDMSEFEELKFHRDSDRWIICSEGRKNRPMWVHLSPKIA
jgi:hypothetical protein